MVDFERFLPPELTELIFSYLPTKDLNSAAECNRCWRDRTNQNWLWIEHCRIRRWLKYGHNAGDLLTKTFAVRHFTTFRPSPAFDLNLSEESLSPLCEWKEVFVKANHLLGNWKYGRCEIHLLQGGHRERISAFDCNGSYIASSSADRTLVVWDFFKLSILHSLMLSSYSIVTAIKLKQNIAVTGSVDGTLGVFDIETGSLLQTSSGCATGLNHLIFDGDTIVGSGEDGKLTVWNLSPLKVKHRLEGHDDEVECMSAWGHFVATGSYDKTVIVWDKDAGRVFHHLVEHVEVVNCCQLDGEIVISGSSDCSVRIWSFASGVCMAALAGHTDVYCLAYDSRVIVAGCADGSVRLWTRAGSVISASCDEHVGAVRWVHLDGERFVSAGDQRKVVVWDARTGGCLNVVHQQPMKIRAAWADETKVITASPEQPGTLAIISYW